MNITILSGGRGSENIIKALLHNKKNHITSLINTFDDGKSTGLIREFFNMPGPSDIRKIHSMYLDSKELNYAIYKKLYDYRIINQKNNKVLSALKSYIDKKNLRIFNFNLKDKFINEFIRINLNYFYNHIIKQNSKIKKFNFNDCSLMNCVYAGSYIKNNKSILKTIIEFENIFKLRGNVIPISNKNLFLSAILENGKILESEDSIINKKIKKKIKQLVITKKPTNIILQKPYNVNSYKKLLTHNYKYKISSNAIKTIKKTDLLIFSPGTLYSSLLPTYLSSGFKKALLSNKKLKKMFFTNIKNEFDTLNYNAIDYINKSLDYINIKKINERKYFFDYIYINQTNNINSKSFVKFDIEIKDYFSKIYIKKLEDKKSLHNVQTLIKIINNI